MASINGFSATAVKATSAELPVNLVSVARYGRYTLVELVHCRIVPTGSPMER